MKNFKNEWNQSYSQGDNNILYPQAEVIKFLNRFVCKRNNDGTLTRHLNKKNTKTSWIRFWLWYWNSYHYF